MSAFVPTVAGLLERAEPVLHGEPAAEAVALLRRRLDEPLRVAIAGRLKAGKSTLLNAIVGEPIASTGAAETTRIVTWYREGVTYRATILTTGGEVRLAQVRRGEASVEIDLGGLAVEAIDRLDVEWPASALRRMTLLDTPGIATLTTELADRTEAALLGRAEPAADAVIYLLRHLHAADAAFLDAWLAASGPIGGVNAVGVLSRADEVGGGGPEAMVAARRIADRYAADPEVRQRCADVVAVAGLLAQAASTLTEGEFRAIATLAGAGRDQFEDLLLSAARFTRAEDGCGLTDLERRHLLSRLGVYGVRLAVTLVRLGVVRTARELAGELAERSGLGQLRRTLDARFAARAGILKARRAASVLDALLRTRADAAAVSLRGDLERAVAGAHELAELQLLGGLRLGATGLPEHLAAEADRIVGGAGALPADRLGVDADAGADVQRAAVLEALARFQPVTVHPMSSPSAVAAARTVIRSLEGLYEEVG